MAPEVHMKLGASQPSDVYSFGICMWEVYTRQKPWNHLSDAEWSRLPELVISGQRPPVPTEHAHIERNKRYLDLMAWCWQGTKGSRPTFEQIVKALREIERCNLAPKPSRFSVLYG